MITFLNEYLKFHQAVLMLEVLLKPLPKIKPLIS